ncbi:MAG: methyltransferase domain-containing protein [Planctomycetota bacterium]
MTSPPEPDAYLLGTTEPELQRLELQNDLWKETTRALWDRAGFAPGDALLELGCGPGFSALDLAKRVGPEGSILGWDRSAAFLSHLTTIAQAQGTPWVETRQGEVSGDLAEEDHGRFDGIFSRWLLCWMECPQDAIRLAHQALRTDGKLVLFDYFHYRSLDLLPHDPAFRRGIAAVEAAWEAAGGNPDLGTLLPEMVVEAGFEIVDVRLHTRFARPEDPLWDWPTSFFPEFMRQLVRDGFLEAHEAEAFLGTFRRSQGHPQGMFLAPPMIELVARKQ